MVAGKPLMLSELTTRLDPMVERWTTWQSKGGERVGGVTLTYLEVNMVKFKIPIFTLQ